MLYGRCGLWHKLAREYTAASAAGVCDHTTSSNKRTRVVCLHLQRIPKAALVKAKDKFTKRKQKVKNGVGVFRVRRNT